MFYTPFFIEFMILPSQYIKEKINDVKIVKTVAIAGPFNPNNCKNTMLNNTFKIATKIFNICWI